MSLQWVSHLPRGQRLEAAAVEELHQGARWDSAANPEQQGQRCVHQIETSGLQAGGTAPQRVLRLERVEAVGRQWLVVGGKKKQKDKYNKSESGVTAGPVNLRRHR